ncbi:MAG: N-6 DNA methylase [Eubacteriaceae bacterium]|jgi:type I restriction enzyme M protein
MNEITEDRIYSRMSSSMGSENMLNGAILVTETRNENKTEMSKEEAYKAMLLVADKLHMPNPFQDRNQFYQTYSELDENPDWEKLLYIAFQGESTKSALVPNVLFQEMTAHIKDETRTIMIAEAEKFVPNLKAVVDAHKNCQFTLTSMNALYTKILKRIFAGYENVTVLNTSIYNYSFLDEKFDLIISVPAFGARNLAEDSVNFICRECEMAALQNLLLHISDSGELVIAMPARITFGGGRVDRLRKFVTQNYKLEEVAELPFGIFRHTGIKTCLLGIGGGRTEDVAVRRYDAAGRKTMRDPVEQLELTDDMSVTVEDLDGIGNWSIDKLLTKQDEEYMKYQASNIRKVPLGEVAEIFRGKSVSGKNPIGPIGVVNITNIGQYEIDYDSLDKLDEEDRKIQNYILREGDLLLPARGTVIRTAVFHEQVYPCIASSNVIVIRPDRKKMNSTYLKIFIDSPIGNKLISSLQQGMAVMNISYNDLKILEVPFPAIADQDRTACEYENSYRTYIQSISEAEKRWQDTLDKLEIF